MRELYHYPLCPFGRLVRIHIKEKSLDHELIADIPWNRKKTFSQCHVFSDLPTLVDMDGTVLEGWYAIVEHLEQHYRSSTLLRITQKEKAETRIIMALFNEMFFADITKNVVFEKVIKKSYTQFSNCMQCLRVCSEVLIRSHISSIVIAEGTSIATCLPSFIA